MKKLINILEKIYLLFFTILLLLMITINHLVQGNIEFSKNIIIEEEYIESLYIIIMFFIGFVILKLYKKEVIKKNNRLDIEVKKGNDLKKRLEEDFKYIGKINVQMQEIKKTMVGLDKFPENKSDFRNMHDFLLNEVLGIVNTEWLISRIIDLGEEKVLHEKTATRKKVTIFKYQISTRQLIDGNEFKDYVVVTSKQDNLGLKIFFVLPKRKYEKNDYIFMQAIIQQLEMIYVIYNSKYYKKR